MASSAYVILVLRMCVRRTLQSWFTIDWISCNGVPLGQCCNLHGSFKSDIYQDIG